VYTIIIFFMAFVVTILTALQTRKTAYGVYTTYPESLGWDHFICPNKTQSRSRAPEQLPLFPHMQCPNLRHAY